MEDPNFQIESSNNMQGIYKNVEKVGGKLKVLIVSDGMIANKISNKKG